MYLTTILRRQVKQNCVKIIKFVLIINLIKTYLITYYSATLRILNILHFSFYLSSFVSIMGRINSHFNVIRVRIETLE